MAVTAKALSSWDRITDYIFGRNALIGVASLMLLIISGYATWSGMADFIIGSTTSPASQSREIPGGLSVSNEILVIAITVALTFLMWLALRETFGAQRRWTERLVTLPLYLFLALWSIGFGYGFWWSLIAGEEATRTSLSGLQEDARDAGAVVTARLEAVRIQLDSVVNWSDSQMAREETSGGSCGVASGAGRGPLYNARKSVRDSVASLRDGIQRSWIEPVQADLEILQQTASRLDGQTVAERQQRFEDMASSIRGRARAIAARSNELGQSTATEMNALAAAVSVAPGQAGFSCFDPTLAQRLRQAAIQAAEPAQLKLREAAFNEGPAGVANAVKNLWQNIGAYGYALGYYVFTFGGTPESWTNSGDPITGRDLIALLATVGIDLGLFVLMLLNPPAVGPVRRDGLSATQSRLHLPPEAVIRHLVGAIKTAIARAPGADLEWVRQHLIHHNGASYFVIPNLFRCGRDPNQDPEAQKTEEKKGLAINQLVGVLDDLRLVVALTPDELKKFGEEEARESYSDLSQFRERYIAGDKPKKGVLGRISYDKDTMPNTDAGEVPERVRNHGLLSKAVRVLDIAGWSPLAQSDAEIFKLTDTEGLTPLLTVLNEGILLEDGSTTSEPDRASASEPKVATQPA